MPARDIHDDIAAILHPISDGLAMPEHADEAVDVTVEERHRHAEETRTIAEATDAYDPLLEALGDAYRRKIGAERDIRALLAYGREFVRPRPYRLVDLAEACGMSISGIRTVYDHADVDEVAAQIGAKPREWRAQDE